MQEIEKLISQLVDSIADGSVAALKLGSKTGDVDMLLLSGMLQVLLTATQRGDISELADAVSKFLGKKKGATPSQVLLNNLNFN